MGKLFNLVIHQGNVRGINGNVTAHTAHGDSHIGLFERRCVIDAIPDHTHLLSLLLIRSNLFKLIFRQTVCMNFLNSQLSANDVGRILVVASEEDRLNPQRMNVPDHLSAFLPDCVCQNDIACQRVVNRNINHRAAVHQIFSCCNGEVTGNRNLLQQLQITGFHSFAVYNARDTFTGNHGKLLRLQKIRL